MDLYGFLSEIAVSEHAFISIIGGGGKTTLMTRFAQYLRKQGKSVLITTTTKVMSPYLHDYDQDLVFSDDSVLQYQPEPGQTVFYAIRDDETRKWHCPPLENLKALKNRYDVVINEADGAKRRPVKVHTERDPVIPDFTTHTISVFGLWAIGKNTSEVAFGDERETIVDSDYINWLVNDDEGLLKRSIEGHRTIVFNGADENDTDAICDICYPSDVTVLTAAVDKGVLYGKIQ